MENRKKKSQLQNAYQVSELKNDLFFKKRENQRQCDKNVYQPLLFPERSILEKYLINGFDPAPKFVSEYDPGDHIQMSMLFTIIESVFSVIAQRFPAHIHAVTAQGFESKIFLFVLAYGIEKAMM